MKALIFGCGYLGLRVATTWQHEGIDVCATTRSANRAEQFRLSGIHPLIADVCLPETLLQLPEADVVVYAVGFDRSAGRTQEDVTVRGVQNVVHQLQGRCRRFVYISTTAVYGQTTGEWVDEQSECHPTQPGGQYNLAAEQVVRQLGAAANSISVSVLRLAGIYGPGRLLARVDALRQHTPLAGRGDAWLNLIHVDDAVAAVQLAATSAPPDSTYLVVDNRPILRREYFELLAELVNAPSPVFDPDSPARRGSGGINKRCSNRALRDELGWRPLYPTIREGLPSAWSTPDQSIAAG